MKYLAVQTNKSQSSLLHLEEIFSKSLYINSNLFRILLCRPICQSIIYSKWYRINLKLVTEMGLPVYTHSNPIELSGTILINQSGHYRSLGQIESRPVSTEDNWEPDKMAKSQGFDSHCSHGTLEYSINLSGLENKLFYIALQANEKVKNVLPLCIGPIRIQNHEVKECCWLRECPKVEQQQYRALKIGREQTKYFLVKERWEKGMLSKIWDSALVMVDILSSDIYLLSGKHILDLSAGTGYIGLSIAQLFQTLSDKSIKKPRVTLSDVHEALDLIKSNQALNYIKDSNCLNIEPLYWGNAQDAKKLLSKQKGNMFDIIIASDIIYRRSDFSNIITGFLQLCSPTTIIYLGYKTRGLKPHEEDEFFNRCKMEFNIKPLDNTNTQHNSTDVKVYRLQPNKLHNDS